MILHTVWAPGKPKTLSSQTNTIVAVQGATGGGAPNLQGHSVSVCVCVCVCVYYRGLNYYLYYFGGSLDGLALRVLVVPICGF